MKYLERGAISQPLCAIFEANGDRPTPVQYIDCHGDETRDLLLVANEQYAVCANQFSDNCSVYRVEKGRLTYVSSFDIPAPIAIVE